MRGRLSHKPNPTGTPPLPAVTAEVAVTNRLLAGYLCGQAVGPTPAPPSAASTEFGSIRTPLEGSSDFSNGATALVSISAVLAACSPEDPEVRSDGRSSVVARPLQPDCWFTIQEQQRVVGVIMLPDVLTSES